MIGMSIRIALVLLLAPALVAAETILIDGARDATLIEDPEGALANGAGPIFFVGRTNQRQDSVRRGLVYFEVAGILPEKARVESVRMTLYMAPSNAVPSEIGLHRLLSEWGEGESFATGGGGDLSGAGDSTWIHSFYDDEFWAKPGGQFVSRTSALRTVAGPAFYTWESTPKMVADVRLWLAAPDRNFGWILIGDEATPQNVKTFSSREEPDVSLRPVLELTYGQPGD